MKAGFLPKRLWNSSARLFHLSLSRPLVREHITDYLDLRMIESGSQILVQFIQIGENRDRKIGSHVEPEY